jgi:PucR family transcriptional regulator, purine catabolism regulatory protein
VGPLYALDEAPLETAPPLYRTYNRHVTLRIEEILRIPDLSLKLVAGKAGRRNLVRGVHVSELEDPTPWLKGGELLLTVGMGVGKTPARQRAYLERLAEAGLAGLGFGTGFSYARVPKGVRDAAERSGFPVFEVPYAVPFLAITDAVFSRLAGEQIDVLHRSLEAQNALTRAVLDGHGVAGLTKVLADSIDGWVLVLDLHGLPLAAQPGPAGARAHRLWEEIQASRRGGSGFSLSLVDGGDHVSVQPVGARGHTEAFLAVGKREALGQLDRLVASHALSLLAIELDRLRTVADVERRLRGDLLDDLAGGSVPSDQADRALVRFGFDPAGQVSVVALEASASLDDLRWAAEEVLSRRGGGFLTSPREDDLFLLLSTNGQVRLEDLQREISERLGVEVRVGAGSPVPAPQAGKSLREAGYALQVCRMEGRSVADFGSLGTYRLLLTLQDPHALRAFADSVLAPLDRYDAEHGGELLPSLWAFLEHNARWEAAAAKLYVHRHTLRYRMRKVEELTGRNLASAHDRMELWLAQRARDLLSEGSSAD